MTVEYTDGSQETLDVLPRKSRTKRGSFIALEMNTLEEGVKFKKSEMIAGTKNFKLDSGLYTSGKNVNIAVMNYKGFSFEDAYVISENLAEETTTDVIKEIFITVPPETKVYKLEENIGKKTEHGDVLVEFSYEENIDDYLAAYELDIEAEEGETTITEGKSSLKLTSPGGEIIDIKVEVNNKMKSDKRLLELHKNLVNRKLDIKTRLEKGKKDPNKKIKASDNLDMKFFEIGGHKYKGQEFIGIRVSYLVRSLKPLRSGDKIANRYGAKGVISHIITKDEKPKANSGEIDVFLSPASVFGRRNVAAIKELYLGKLTYVLNNKIINMATGDNVKVDKIIKLITDFYKSVGSDKTQAMISKKINSISPATFKKKVANKEFKLFTIVEPFHNISFEAIKAAAKLLNTELDEYVTYKNDKGEWVKTDKPVPVGKTYVQFLEHYSATYASIGGAQKYSGVNKQPMKVGSGQNVSSIGQMD